MLLRALPSAKEVNNYLYPFREIGHKEHKEIKEKLIDRVRPGELVFKVIASKASNYLVVETSNE